MTLPSLRLAACDFDAYLPERATSNAFSRPRIEVKQRAMAWARGVVARLSDLGMALDLHGSDEHPSLRNKKRVDCQWVFFWRDQAARDELDRLLERGRPMSAAIDDPSPYTRHAFLALRIDSDAVEVCFAVHPDAKVDVDNLHARLAGGGDTPGDPEPALAAEFISALRRLPEEFLIGVGARRAPCETATPEVVVDLLLRAADGQVPLWIGWSIPRGVAIEHVEILGEQLEDALVALAPIYRLVAWSRENDHILWDRRLEGFAKERARTHAEVEAQTERWRVERDAARERSIEAARVRHDEAACTVTLATLFRADGPRLDSVRSAQKPATDHPATETRAVSATRAGGPFAHAAAASVAPPVVDKGSRVRVLAGPFADKCGVVSELDGRGGARVLLGLLSTRLEVADLQVVVDGRERPALQSSHLRPDARGAAARRPAPLAPRKAR